MSEPASVDDLYAAFIAQQQEQDSEPAPALEDALDAGQLPMWMSAREIREHYQGLDNDRLAFERNPQDADEALFDRKLFEAKRVSPDGDELPLHIVVDEDTGRTEALGVGETLADDVRENGVRSPVGLQADRSRVGMLGKPEIVSGHHRVAAMSAYRPDDLIAVRFYDDEHHAWDEEHAGARKLPYGR